MIQRVAPDGAALCCLVRNPLRVRAANARRSSERRRPARSPSHPQARCPSAMRLRSGDATDFFMPAASAGEDENVDAWTAAPAVG